MSTATAAANPVLAQFLQFLGFEHKTTMKVLQALPADRLDFKPHERNMSARQMGWHVAYSPYGLARIVATASMTGYSEPPPPEKLDEIVAGCESYYQQTCDLVAGLTAEQLQANIVLPNGQSMPTSGLLWNGVLFHQIHHRGQLAIYIRMMGGKVPSIYGPSGDENPFGARLSER
ncbi:MAG: DinB family protein [Acidobacteria bacterium]|nr:DinB family protein [Acidobacteriota bacterium]